MSDTWLAILLVIFISIGVISDESLQKIGNKIGHISSQIEKGYKQATENQSR